ncbi:hypothetical protein AB0I98_10890 [Streptomyces sp. NPDC050211]|uniref:hypothetical protein n=1 Tax=Streptomyces sp. NPDC050211 TaxID=3154932 RepID=UPI00342F594B
MELLDRPDPGLIHELAARHAELRAQQYTLRQQLAAELKAEDEHERHRAGMGKPLSQVPVAPGQVSCLPDELSRALFDAVRLTVRYDGRTGEAVCRIVLPFPVTNEALHHIEDTDARPVRCEVAAVDAADAEAVRQQQAQALVRVLGWLAGQGGDGT